MRAVLVSGFLRLAFGNLCPLIWYKPKCHLWKTNVPEKMVARSHIASCSFPFCPWRLLLELILVNFKSIQSIMALNFSNGSKAFDVWALEACLASLELKFLYIGTIDQSLFSDRGKRQFTLPMVVLWSSHYYYTFYSRTLFLFEDLLFHSHTLVSSSFWSVWETIWKELRVTSQIQHCDFHVA